MARIEPSIGGLRQGERGVPPLCPFGIETRGSVIDLDQSCSFNSQKDDDGTEQDLVVWFAGK